MYEEIDRILAVCWQQGSVDAVLWPHDWISPSYFGLEEDQKLIRPATAPDLLSPRILEQELALSKVFYHHVVGSTNSLLLELAEENSVDNCLAVAECQLDGRGRRGRSWVSPYARNLAFSLGKGIRRRIDQIGGLSLVAGLAVANVLEPGAAQLKWPNDVVVGDAKLSGVLVELVSKENTLEIVVGIGLNLDFRDSERVELDREVTDLRALNIDTSRTDLLVQLVNTLQKFLTKFDEAGFEPFVERFNQSHIYHHKTCNIQQGDTIITGRVEGVDVDGALILSTENGIRSFHGGEVSLRAT